MLKRYGKPNSVMDGVMARSDGDVDGVQRLLGPDVVATSCPCPATAPHHVPRLRINVSGQPFELPVALLARHPGTHLMQNSEASISRFRFQYRIDTILTKYCNIDIDIW